MVWRIFLIFGTINGFTAFLHIAVEPGLREAPYSLRENLVVHTIILCILLNTKSR